MHKKILVFVLFCALVPAVLLAFGQRESANGSAESRSEEAQAEAVVEANAEVANQEVDEAADVMNDSEGMNDSQTPVAVEDVIACYQSGANAMDIDAYMSCFAEGAEIMDLSRLISGNDNIRAWAINEVIPYGDTFAHRRILEQSEGFAKTEVNWRPWVVHYSYRWNEAGLITFMDLQYAE